jgi:hypothetical protein
MDWLSRLLSRRHRYESVREQLNEKIADLMDRGLTRKQTESLDARVRISQLHSIDIIEPATVTKCRPGNGQRT